MVNNVTDSYAIGEIFDGDAGYACQYQRNGLDGFLNFPVYFQVRPSKLYLIIDGVGILFHWVDSNACLPQRNHKYRFQLHRSHCPWNIHRNPRRPPHGILHIRSLPPYNSKYMEHPLRWHSNRLPRPRTTLQRWRRSI